MTMRLGGVVALAVVLSAACSRGPEPGSLAAAQAALDANAIESIEFTASGRWYQFGQAPSPTLPWPRFDVSSYTATVNFTAPAARVQMVRLQTVEPGRARPAPVEQRVDAYVSGGSAWNMPPAGAPSPAPQPQPAALEERIMEIWTTPQGFLKAAAANQASSEPAEGGSRVSFTIGGRHRYVGQINAENQVVRVQTWIDNTVLGDTPVEFVYTGYRDYGGVQFPARIVRTQGGHPVLELDVTAVTANAPATLNAPADVATFTPPALTATAEPLAPGVYYIRGGSHHSVAIDQQDHIVVVEAPQNEARSLAVIAKVKETIPNKPIRYVINSHHHFDHSGGLRTFVDEGATVITHEANRPYYEQAWAAPRTLNPDRLAQSKKSAQFEVVGEKHVLTDDKRSIEIHHLAGNGHNDAFVMVYLPAEKIVIEVDAWAPTAPNVPPPATPSPFAVNLLENIQRLKLDVQQIAALHGPRIASLADLQAAVAPVSR